MPSVNDGERRFTGDAPSVAIGEMPFNLNYFDSRL
jgi:hypothetical protein